MRVRYVFLMDGRDFLKGCNTGVHLEKSRKVKVIGNGYFVKW